MGSRTATQIATVFPGPTTLYPSRKKWLIILAGSLLFTAGGYWMIRDHETSGWFVLAFFGLCSIIAAAILLPGAASLKFDGDGFEVTNFFRRQRISWRQASHFEVAAIPPSNIRVVVYDDATLADRKIAKVNVQLTGRNTALGDTYGLAAEELAEIMKQWRERALASPMRSFGRR